MEALSIFIPGELFKSVFRLEKRFLELLRGVAFVSVLSLTGELTEKNPPLKV